MSLEKDVFDQLVIEYPHGVVDITELSFNNTGNFNFIESVQVGFNFDLVHNLSAAYAVSHKEKTPDSLFLVNDVLFFVEFKEGGHNKADIRLKIHEGLVSLYMFVLKHMPHVTRDEFFSLRISYIVIARPPTDLGIFALALSQAKDKYQLENLQGFIVKDTAYSICPNVTARLIRNLTNGSAVYIDIHQRDGSVSRVVA